VLTRADKARENRLRRLAERQNGMFLSRVGRRDPDAWDYASYWLVPDPEHRLWLDAHENELQPMHLRSLDDVEDYLVPKRPAQKRVEQRAARRGLIIERASANGTSARAIWLSSKTDKRCEMGSFLDFRRGRELLSGRRRPETASGVAPIFVAGPR
jgi:hypothetical protein